MALRLVSSNTAVPAPARTDSRPHAIGSTVAEQAAQKLILAFKLDGVATIAELIEEFRAKVGLLNTNTLGSYQRRTTAIYMQMLDVGIIAIEATESQELDVFAYFTVFDPALLCKRITSLTPHFSVLQNLPL